MILTERPKLNIQEYQLFPDGKRVDLLTNKVPLFNKENNKIVGVLGSYTDITHIKKIEHSSDSAVKLTEELHTTTLSQIEQLTKRELDCVNKFVFGYTAKEIAKVLNLSPRTVEDRLQSAKAKLGCSRRSEVVRIMLGNK